MSESEAVRAEDRTTLQRGFYKLFSILGDIVQQIDRDQIDCRRTLQEVSNILYLVGARPITGELSTTMHDHKSSTLPPPLIE